ncbi:fibronectin type III domain-containing protein [Clostridium lacusfryxellense]|uniref:fibronectin type III domain-containing protein n=1 Tax=Clostridium lacusfryxellense TaxID=205328 RepID=UPI001C0D9EB3|nr:InlB B-repeat-containing protein [Clostridium lacusfryxellense]MBU3111008.1 InlB B-repeat-containing protein [Clostridium lacusfryxellense]
MVKIKFKIVLSILFLLLFVNITAVYAEGGRTTPYRAWTNHQFSLQEYDFQTPKKVQLQLLEFYKGTQANSIVANENMFNEVPAYDEEWLIMKFKMKYVSGPEVELTASDIISSGSTFYTNYGTNISPLAIAAFSSNLEGLGEYDVSFYPGGESVVWYGILVKKTVGYPLIRIGTGFNSSNYESIYSWFSTDPKMNYIVTFNSNGGSAVASKSVEYNTKSIKPLNPTKSGYTFGGWYKSNTFTNLFDFANTQITDNITLYAKWVPATPTSVKSVATSYNSIKLTWQAVAGARGYDVYRASSSTGIYSLVSTTTSISYSNASLITGNTYYYKVRAYTTIGTTKVYSNCSAATSSKTTLSAPTSVKASSSSYNSNNVSWNAVTGTSKYEIYRAGSSAGIYKLISTTTATSYKNTGLVTNSNYYYKVRGYRMVGNVKVCSVLSAVVSAKPIPATPTNFKAARINSASIKLSWNTVTGASGYEIYKATSKLGAYNLLTGTTNFYYTNSHLTRSKTYYYKMRSYRTVGKIRVYGKWTSIVYAKL